MDWDRLRHWHWDVVVLHDGVVTQVPGCCMAVPNSSPKPNGTTVPFVQVICLARFFCLSMFSC